MSEATGGWEFAGQPAITGTGTVTLVEGSSFCVCQTTGDITPGATSGLFFRDTRILSAWGLRVDGATPELLAVMEPHSFEAKFIARTTPPRDVADSTVLVERHRFVGVGMREDIVVRNLADHPVELRLELRFDADFADLFAVKESRVVVGKAAPRETNARGVVLSHPDPEVARGVLVHAEGWRDQDDGNALGTTVSLAGRATWRSSIEVCPIVDGEELTPSFGADHPSSDISGSARSRIWAEGAPVVDTGHPGLSVALRASIRDLGALRIFDPADPHLPAVAAGAPWFMALFGRDSLISSYLTLLFDQNLALGTLRMLARHQGKREDPLSEEQPGRILHESRFGTDLHLALGGGGTYYGTADATPLFVMLLGELARWGLPTRHVETLLPHADRALEWIRVFGDRDGDGFVEYERSSERGLANQGWKDSWDGVNFADGRLADPPIALAEVQGYVYAAYRARAALARALEDEDTARACTAEADRLKRLFNEAFWLPEQGYYAIALDRNKRPVDGLASNMGHCLWTGIIDKERGGDVVARLMADDMFSGWGVRTLSSTMSRYNPMSYHNGSVWPHDNALIVSGFANYGFFSEAQRLSMALINAAEATTGRLPELFCGFPREDYPEPVPYPTSCSPQAWAAATPVHLLRVMLGIEPDIASGRLAVAPQLASSLGEVSLDNLPLAGARLQLRARNSALEVSGLPTDVQVTFKNRGPAVIGSVSGGRRPVG